MSFILPITKTHSLNTSYLFIWLIIYLPNPLLGFFFAIYWLPTDGIRFRVDSLNFGFEKETVTVIYHHVFRSKPFASHCLTSLPLFRVFFRLWSHVWSWHNNGGVCRKGLWREFSWTESCFSSSLTTFVNGNRPQINCPTMYYTIMYIRGANNFAI